MIIPGFIIDEQLHIRKKIQDFKNGTLPEAEFKPYRASFGIYEQRQDGTFMVRPRIPSGVISLEQFRAVVNIARKVGLSWLHLTTRQDIQFHGVLLDQIPTVIEELTKVGLITKGTGGNTARNIAASPLSGVSQDDVFDVTPYALATAEHLLLDPTAYSLPRKYKIAFSNSPADTANATLTDLGFIARIQDGQKGFSVFGGGGLGGSPNPAILLHPFIPANKILYYVAGMKILFEREGDRQNRNKARIRFILKRLGEDGFRNMLEACVEEIRQSCQLDLPDGFSIDVNDPEESTCMTLTEAAENPGSGNIAHGQSGQAVKDQRLVHQKQPGRFSVHVHPFNGNITLDQLDAVLDWIGQLPQAAGIRLTGTQSFYVRDLDHKQADALLELVEPFTGKTTLEQSTACTGAATCRLGICRSPDLLDAIRGRFSGESAEVRSALPHIYISGCPNSCGQHEIGLIGLSGRKQRTEAGLTPVYTLFLGGSVSEDGTSFGQPAGDIPAKKIPGFLLELARLKTLLPDIDFSAFLRREADGVNALVRQWRIVTAEDGPDIVNDFGTISG